MKKWLLLLWLLLPLPVIVWHYGPGQQWLARDKADSAIREAQKAEAVKDWARAETLYREASTLAADAVRPLKARLDLALTRVRFRQGGAVEAIDSIDRLLTARDFNELPPDLQGETRELAGRIHYYAAWVMRLEGAQRDLWMEEAELSRQNFRMLSEQDLAASIHTNNYTQTQQTNLETAVRLQRMSLTELMGRPLPEEGHAMAGQGLSEQMARRRGQRGKGNRPGIGEGDNKEPGSGAGTQRFPGGPGS